MRRLSHRCANRPFTGATEVWNRKSAIALDGRCTGRMKAITLRENDLEGKQDMGGKHGGQAGTPNSENRSAAQQGIVRYDKGQEQPADKDRDES